MNGAKQRSKLDLAGLAVGPGQARRGHRAAGPMGTLLLITRHSQNVRSLEMLFYLTENLTHLSESRDSLAIGEGLEGGCALGGGGLNLATPQCILANQVNARLGLTNGSTGGTVSKFGRICFGET